jgi:hypothetical protein
MAPARRKLSEATVSRADPAARLGVVESDDLPERNRIYTFYSYKGGTGRSMALANVAWILASNRKRVLVIDWDLEAPGLHRYFAPFLPDPELLQSEGLIDFVSDFSEAARFQHRGATESGQATGEGNWYEEYADLLRYAVSLEHEFPGAGTIDFVPAGRQGASYGIRVSSFNWTEFYQKLGGGILLETVKRQLLAEYDYILIDSRTGLSDTAGICTVQMPGELVVFFTLNRQSILGAAAAAHSAAEQRRTTLGESTLRVWPVATRVDPVEKERLEAARSLARETFAPFVNRTVKRRLRENYWGQVEVPYIPFYAYEEILATIADRPKLRSSMLAAMESLTSAITEGAIKAMPPMLERARVELRARLLGKAEKARSSAKFYLSYGTRDLPPKTISSIATALEAAFGAENVVWDHKVPLGAPLMEWLDRELESSDCVLFLIGRGWLESEQTQRELQLATSAGKSLVPILVARDVTWAELPKPLGSVMGFQLPMPQPRAGLNQLIERLRSFTPAPEVRAPLIRDPDDPQRGRWGGRNQRDGRKLSATVRAVSRSWYAINLTVTSTTREPLTGKVKFHLHSTFDPNVETVPVVDGQATLTLHAYGAFTVGAETDGGRTRLELDLSTLSQAPKAFREH